MTEAEWLACTDPEPMLEFLQARVDDRKLRLFVCVCGRRVWKLLDNQASERAVEVAEQFADGGATVDELGAAFFAAVNAADLEILEPGVFNARSAAMIAATKKPNIGDTDAAIWYALRAVPVNCSTEELASLLRDLIPNPFRSIVFDNAWRTPTLTQLAEAAYDDRLLPAGTLDPDRLAVLADALEDAGCDNVDLLSHLRGPGPHVRGCWVLDLLLGKE